MDANGTTIRDAGTPERHLSTLRRGAPVVGITVVVVTVIAVALSLSQSSLYKASTNVFVSTGQIGVALPGVAGAASSSDPDRVLTTQAQVARVPRVAQIAVRKAGVPGMTAAKLLDESTVTPESGAEILVFDVTDEDPSAARALADAYASAYVTYRAELDTGSVRQALRAVNNQIAAVGNSNPDLLTQLTASQLSLRTKSIMRGSNATVGAPASSTQKVQPRPVSDGLLGAIVGLLLGITLIFVRDSLNTRVRSTAEIEERLHLPLIGRIPPPPKQLSEHSGIAVLEETHSFGAEAYRMLATNIELLNLERGASSLMIVSPAHQDGKSTTMANLASIFARRGLNVVLMEADLRKPTVGKLFDIDPERRHKGLADVALGRLELEDALVSIPLGNDETATDGNGNGGAKGKLDLLLAGTAPPSPGEFLQSQAVAKIVDQLKERCDLLLIDTPPLLHVGDAMSMVLNINVDCAIVAVRLGFARRPTVTELHRILESFPVVKLGFVATGEESREEYAGSYGYGAYSYYHHEAETGAREVLKSGPDG
jgi:tyrosine-protein kinase